MKKFKILLLIILGCNSFIFAQQDALFTQYTFNKLLVNPAYAGSREGLQVTLINRAQWINIEGAPNTLTLSAHTASRDRKVGVGMYVFRDAIGPTVNNGLMGTYSYRILTEKSAFSFGLQAGFTYFDFDYSKMNLKDADYIFDPAEIQKFTPDFNLGMYYQTNRFFAGLSSKHLIEKEFGYIFDEDKTTFSRLARHFYLMSGTVIPMAEKILFRPSGLVKFVKNAPVQIDLNASVLFGNTLMVGASFRTEKAATVMMEIGLTDKIKLGYSYDIYFNELQLYNYGSSEIRLEFNFSRADSKMRTPRYF